MSKKILVVYDNTGKVFFHAEGEVELLPVPDGLQFLVEDLPEGKRLIHSEIQVDVNAEPHAMIFEDVPKTQLDELTEELRATQDAINLLLTSI